MSEKFQQSHLVNVHVRISADQGCLDIKNDIININDFFPRLLYVCDMLKNEEKQKKRCKFMQRKSEMNQIFVWLVEFLHPVNME